MLRRHLAQKCPEEGPGSAKRKKEFDEQKSALVAALAAKVKALLDKAGLGAAAKAAVAGAEGTEAGGEPDGDGGAGAEGPAQEPVPKEEPAPGTTTLAAAAAEVQAEAGAEAGAPDVKEPAEDDAIEQAFRCAHRSTQLLVHETGNGTQHRIMPLQHSCFCAPSGICLPTTGAHNWNARAGSWGAMPACAQVACTKCLTGESLPKH